MLSLPAKNPLPVLLVAFLFFVWGATAIQYKAFPYQLFEPFLEVLGGSKMVDAPPAAAGKSDLSNSVEMNRRWAKNVISGGYILHFRHAQREKWNDVQAFDAYELKKGFDAEKASFSRAVCLTSQGIEEAKLIGNIFSLMDVKISQVISSPSCRARQTAMYAFGRIDAINNALLHRTAMMEEQHPIFAKELRDLIDGLQLKPGQNVLLSGHGGTLKYDGAVVIDVDNTDGMDTRDETGFVVIERREGKTIAQHRFKSIKEFTTAVLELPIK